MTQDARYTVVFHAPVSIHEPGKAPRFALAEVAIPGDAPAQPRQQARPDAYDAQGRMVWFDDEHRGPSITL